MTCPVCGEDTEVLCTRGDCETTVRRYRCKECGYTFHTKEEECEAETYRMYDREYHAQRRQSPSGKISDRI